MTSTTIPPEDGVGDACQEMLADYMTSETHHPGYVLVPTGSFEKMRSAFQSRRSQPDREAIIEECAKVADGYIRSPDNSVIIAARWIGDDIRSLKHSDTTRGK